MVLLEDKILARLNANFRLPCTAYVSARKTRTTAAAALFPSFHMVGKTEQVERQATAYRCSDGRQPKYDEGKNRKIPGARLSGGPKAVAAAVAVVLCMTAGE